MNNFDCKSDEKAPDRSSAKNSRKRECTTRSKRELKRQLQYIVPEIKLALIKENRKKNDPVCGPEDIEKFVEPMRHYAEEHFVAFHLDAKNHVVGYQIVSHGTLSQSLVHPREVFKAAVIGNAHSILVAHNHPSGSISPSLDDIGTTEKLIEAGELMGIPVIDHVIVTDSDLLSIRQENPHLWS